MVALVLAPQKATALPRNATWILSLALIFAGSTGATAATLGLPLWQKSTMRVVTVASLLGIAAGLLLVVDWSAPTLSIGMGAPCFAFCTVVSAIAMVTLGILSGRLWRRFPDPGLVMAVGVTGVGITALHFTCGGTDPVHLMVFHLAPLGLVYAIAQVFVRLREKVIQDD